MRMICCSAVLGLICSTAFGQVERVWLSHRSHDPSKLMVNWTTKTPGESIVRFGTTKSHGQEVRLAGLATLHHVEIPLTERDTVYHYSVGSGIQTSPDATFKAYPSDDLRVAVVANWHSRPDLSGIVKDDVHLLLTAGDNISSIWQRCGEDQKDCTKPYEDLIDAYP